MFWLAHSLKGCAPRAHRLIVCLPSRSHKGRPDFFKQEPSMSRIKTHRRNAFLEQSGRCFYCSAEMWLTQPDRFASRHGISEREARRFRCTAEHLVARSEGGSDARTNIVAACKFCNSIRHQTRCAPEPTAYVQYVQRRLRAGRWHPSRYRHLVVDAVRERPAAEAG